MTTYYNRDDEDIHVHIRARDGGRHSYGETTSFHNARHDTSGRYNDPGPSTLQAERTFVRERRGSPRDEEHARRREDLLREKDELLRRVQEMKRLEEEREIERIRYDEEMRRQAERKREELYRARLELEEMRRRQTAGYQDERPREYDLRDLNLDSARYERMQLEREFPEEQERAPRRELELEPEFILREQERELARVKKELEDFHRQRELESLRRDIFVDRRQHEATWAMRYQISTLTRHDNHEYRLLDLSQSDSTDQWKDIPRDVFDVHRGRDLTVRMDLPIHIDHSSEIEDFSRLKRHGNFAEAKRFFEKHLQQHLSHPFMFIQYADLLLSMGDYKSLAGLDPKPAFGSGYTLRPKAFRKRQEDGGMRIIYHQRGLNRRRRHARSRRPPDPEPSSSQQDSQGIPPDLHGLGTNEARLLHLRWRLIESLAICHTKGTLNEALADATEALYALVARDDLSSTEIQIICLSLRVFSLVGIGAPDIFRLEIENACLDWVPWPNVYHALLESGQIWDFTDLFIAVTHCFGPAIASELFFPGDSVSLARKLGADWTEDDDDESTALAQLDLLRNMLLSASGRSWRDTAKNLVRRISEGHSEAMGTRSVMQWMLTEVYWSIVPDNGAADPNPLAYLENFPGILLGRNRMPIYVPYAFEDPGWLVPEAPESARKAVEMTLAHAREREDYPVQLGCLAMLIILTPRDPSALFKEYGRLQKEVMGDMTGYLRTLLSSYLVCYGKEAERELLAELRLIDNWVETNTLRYADLHLAKQQIERVLTAKVNGTQQSFTPVTRSSMIFYPWLSENALRFVERLETGNRNPRRREGETVIEDYNPGLTRSRSLRTPRRQNARAERATSGEDPDYSDGSYDSGKDSSGEDDEDGDDGHYDPVEKLIKRIRRDLGKGRKVEVSFGGGKEIHTIEVDVEGDRDIERSRGSLGRDERLPQSETRRSAEAGGSRSKKKSKKTKEKERKAPAVVGASNAKGKGKAVEVHTDEEDEGDHGAVVEYGANPIASRTPPAQYGVDDSRSLVPITRDSFDGYIYSDFPSSIRVYPWA